MCTTEREKPFGKQNHREEMHMRTNFYLDGKKTTRKAVKELVGGRTAERNDSGSKGDVF